MLLGLVSTETTANHLIKFHYLALNFNEGGTDKN